MNLLYDAVTVLGSRHGLRIDPPNRRAGLIRVARFEEETWFPLRVGFRAAGHEAFLPLCPESESHGFAFLDQRLTPCTASITGIHPGTGLKLRLTIATPFRPRDADFSTTPVLGLRVELSRLCGAYRWTNPGVRPDEAQVLIEIGEGALDVAAAPDGRQLRITGATTAVYLGADPADETEHPACLPLDERLVPLGDAELTERGFRRHVVLGETGAPARLDVAWCGHLPPVLEIDGRREPFRFTRRFRDVDDVARWTVQHGSEIFANAAEVDGRFAPHALGAAWDRLLAYTLHSWLACSWWTLRGAEREWFSVWEGSCYFHATVDVEFTQAPFYLAVWPELLAMQLAQWPQFLHPGESLLGAAGRSTAYLAHDCGRHATVGACRYQHPMPVEESANYLILLGCLARRLQSPAIFTAQRGTADRLLGFLRAADTDRDGIPDVGVSNTLDDGSPAIQFGQVQTYLAVKTLAAYVAVADFLSAGDPVRADLLACCAKIRTRLQLSGWNGDHYNVLLRPSGRIQNPWTGETQECEAIPGWDAAHIYTANALPVTDAAAFDLGLPEEQVRLDLKTAARLCLRAYGCIHTSFVPSDGQGLEVREGLAGASNDPGWISMNILRDLAGLRRGVDLRAMAERYWEWQVTTNTQGQHLFFETFNGNNLHHYPRGVAAWGVFDLPGSPP